MEGNADSLLNRGLAAAQSGNPRDHEEAEFYLEWALRSQPTLEQEALAWYWLSRLTDDPAIKRDRLENVLAARPNHPDARRDLAILDGRLKPDNMRANPRESGAGVAIGGQISDGQVTSFPCPKCGAKLHYDPGMSMVRCQFCGSHADAAGNLISDASASSGIAAGLVSEQDWVAAIYTDQGHSWALPGESVLKCESCGASVTLAPSIVSGKCPYCASPKLIRVAAATMGELREPDGIVPFAVGKSGVLESVRAWLEEQSRRIAVPNDLRDLAALVSGTPIYLPFWTFDVSGQIEWSGYIRASDDITGMSLNDMNKGIGLGGVAIGLLTGNYDIAARSAADMASTQYGGSDLTYAAGSAAVLMDDVLVAASTSLPSELLQKLTYTLKQAVPYREELLANWPAEVYTLSLADASLVARERAMKQADREIEMQTGGGGDPATLRVDRTGLGVMSYKLVLLPIWIVMYTYRGQIYRALINGQTAQIEGETPRRDNLVGKIFG